MLSFHSFTHTKKERMKEREREREKEKMGEEEINRGFLKEEEEERRRGKASMISKMPCQLVLNGFRISVFFQFRCRAIQISFLLKRARNVMCFCAFVCVCVCLYQFSKKIK